MSKQIELLERMHEELLEIRQTVSEEGQLLYESWDPSTMRENFKASAQNLAHYIILRRFDLRELQINMADFGLSSLGRLEGHVMTTLNNVIVNICNALDKFSDQEDDQHYPISNQIGQKKLDENTKAIFGPMNPDRYSHIMVTMPPEAAEDVSFVKKLIGNGMEIARINSAHDGPKDWKKMIKNIEAASKELDQSIQLFFDIPGPKIRIDGLYTTLQNPKVEIGDTFFITSEEMLRDFYDHDIVLRVEQAELIHLLEEGETVSMDDGEVVGKVNKVYPEGVSVKVEQLQKTKGQRIRATKGINFTDREIDIDIITETDKKNIEFIKEYDAVLGFSFVQTPKDIQTIQSYLEEVYGDRAADIPICIKVETHGAFKHLPRIIVEANRHQPCSLMIARGDLAVEVGYLRLSEVQEEILWFAEAANTPVIWATQVLESMSKKGIPTRAEITDATMAGRAEVVMLNKGEYMPETVQLLDQILVNNSKHMLKKTALFRALDVAHHVIK